MKKIIVTLVTAITLSGCASAVRQHSLIDKKYSEIAIAAKEVAALTAIQRGQSVNIKVGDSSPSINYGKAVGKFESVEVSPTSASNFRITIAGICDCLGFRKWSAVPITYLLNDHGDVIAEGTFATPNTQLLTGKFPVAGKYKILIVADSTTKGRYLSDVSGLVIYSGLPIAPFSIPMRSH
ncbi:MAG: lipoprotein, partial [Sulfuriferula sp.]